MSYTIRAEVKPPFTLEEVEEVLRAAEVEILFSTETPDGDTEIVGVSPVWPLDVALTEYAFIHLETLPTIDWEAQWREHVPLTKEGLLVLQIPEYGPLYLLPGAGFGNTSHPTTCLMLDLMENLRGKVVVDVGCGSGILSLVAAAKSAASVVGVDIDADALLHAEENAALNHLQILFCQPEECHLLPGNLVILLNMIRTEQAVAWGSLPQLHHTKAELITSGILEKEEELYLNWTRSLGWKLVARYSQEGWLAFRFTS